MHSSQLDIKLRVFLTKMMSEVRPQTKKNSKTDNIDLCQYRKWLKTQKR